MARPRRDSVEIRIPGDMRPLVNRLLSGESVLLDDSREKAIFARIAERFKGVIDYSPGDRRRVTLPARAVLKCSVSVVVDGERCIVLSVVK